MVQHAATRRGLLGLFGRREVAVIDERRSWPGGGWMMQPQQEWSRTSYADIDPQIGQTSVQSVAVGSSVDLICSLVSELPVQVFSKLGPPNQTRAVPPWLQDPGGDGYGVQDWVAQVLRSWLLRGNVFGDIVQRDPATGFPKTTVLWDPDRVGGYVDTDGRVQWNFSGQPIDNQDDVLHSRVNPVTGSILGLSPIAAHAAMIGLNLTGTAFGLQWFKDGAHPTGVLTNSEASIDKTQADTVKQRFLAALRGNREPAVLGRGWDYKALQVAPEESQFLQTQKYSSAECARIFGPGMPEILGYETGGSLTYVTVQGKSVHLLVYALSKWMNRVDRLLSSMLPPSQYVKLDRDALLETTTLDRYGAYQLALANQWMTANEVRAKENLPPVAWGDQPNATTVAAPQQEHQPTVD